MFCMFILPSVRNANLLGLHPLPFSILSWQFPFPESKPDDNERLGALHTKRRQQQFESMLHFVLHPNEPCAPASAMSSAHNAPYGLAWAGTHRGAAPLEQLPASQRFRDDLAQVSFVTALSRKAREHPWKHCRMAEPSSGVAKAAQQPLPTDRGGKWELRAFSAAQKAFFSRCFVWVLVLIHFRWCSFLGPTVSTQCSASLSTDRLRATDLDTSLQTTQTQPTDLECSPGQT